MPPAELTTRGVHTMTVCNSCRYCEQYCPVFPAIERRQQFDENDLALLANLCHNCGECLYACQYAPPHVFAIDVPRTMAELRLRSYEECCWPRSLALAFRRQGPATASGLAVGFTAVLGALTWWLNPAALLPGRTDAAFYAVIPHAVMVGVFGAVGGAAALALLVSLVRFWRATGHVSAAPIGVRTVLTAARDAATLRYLHAAGQDCTAGEEARTPWRRRWHQATLGGFALCFAATSVAAVYHSIVGWEAPYGFTSLPVVLGTLGGVGLILGPIGQWLAHRRRDPALADPAQRGTDQALLLLLWLTAATGLLLLLLRSTSWMGPLLIVHLGVVLALFVSLPYGKFVHGFYHVLALVRDAAEAAAERGPRRA